MKKKKNAFTLIELLAIIVILAIIAVITVPIVLNIIENAKEGSAQNSAYGYKDAINKYYVSEFMDNNNLKLNGAYTVSSGKLSGPNITNENGVEIPLSGEKPSSGTLVYEDNILKIGCLVIGDYAVMFNNDGTTSTEKGECVPIIASCPGCKFIYTTAEYAIEGSESDDGDNSVMPQGTTNDYTTLIGEEGHPYFLGLIESTSNSTKIGRAFACGIENGTPFCLEGYEPSKYSDNVSILNDIFECGASASNFEAACYGSSVGAYARDAGYVIVYDDDFICGVSDGGNVNCNE